MPPPRRVILNLKEYAMQWTKEQLLSNPVQHIDIARHDYRLLVESMSKMSYSARDLARAGEIYDRMLADKECCVMACLAGSLISAGLKQVFVDMIRCRMVDAIVATGANIVDQDFFEALGFRHYQADEIFRSGMYDDKLRDLMIDRIYDTFIDEEQLRICDHKVCEIADQLEPGAYSSRQFLRAMGEYLDEHAACRQSIVLAAYEHDVPIFVPAFSDCSAGFGLVEHQHQRITANQAMVSIDSVRDFYELTQVKLEHPTTGLFMVGGGVPKNFAQDIVVAADILGKDAPMHKYAIQVTVADVRDGALSSSTLKEASSWGKVDTAYEQMVYSEATLAVPLIAGYAYHQGAWRNRPEHRLNQLYAANPQTTSSGG